MNHAAQHTKPHHIHLSYQIPLNTSHTILNRPAHHAMHQYNIPYTIYYTTPYHTKYTYHTKYHSTYTSYTTCTTYLTVLHTLPYNSMIFNTPYTAHHTILHTILQHIHLSYQIPLKTSHTILNRTAHFAMHQYDILHNI